MVVLVFPIQSTSILNISPALAANVRRAWSPLTYLPPAIISCDCCLCPSELITRIRAPVPSVFLPFPTKHTATRGADALFLYSKAGPFRQLTIPSRSPSLSRSPSAIPFPSCLSSKPHSVPTSSNRLLPRFLKATLGVSRGGNKNMVLRFCAMGIFPSRLILLCVSKSSVSNSNPLVTRMSSHPSRSTSKKMLLHDHSEAATPE